jgi:hypothetical protein
MTDPTPLTGDELATIRRMARRGVPVSGDDRGHTDEARCRECGATVRREDFYDHEVRAHGRGKEES